MSCDFVYVGDQEGVLAVNSDRHCWPPNLVVVRRRVGKNKISGWRDSIGSDALLEMFLDPIQLVHSNGGLLSPVYQVHRGRRAKVWVSSKETLHELPGSASTAIWSGSLMDR